MARYLIFRQVMGSSLLSEDDIEPHYTIVPELDVKCGLFVPGSDPLLAHEPEAIIDADSPADAKAKLLERRAGAFM